MVGMSTDVARSPRRSDALSKERIIAAAIEILDADGESALTFRSLAAALATGAGAIYHHVANKDDLLAAAANSVIADVAGAAPKKAKPREEIRSIALGLFDAIDDHPWVGSQLSREPGGMASTRIIEAVGSRLTELGVPVKAQFDVATALASYIGGVAAQNAANARIAPRDMDRDTFLGQLAASWRELDETEFPFVRQVATQLAKHDDRKQFLAGIDLILAGIPGTWPPS